MQGNLVRYWKLFVPKIQKSTKMQMGLSLLCALFIFLANCFPIPVISFLIAQLDNKIYDQIVQLNWRTQVQNPRVIIIDIDNKSVQAEGRWPWPRNKMAALIDSLKQAGVVTIGMDIVMSEPEVNYALGLKAELAQKKLNPNQQNLPLLLDEIAPEVDNDQIFAHSLLEHNVVLGFLFHNDESIRKGVLPNFLHNTKRQPLKATLFNLHYFKGYNGCLKLFLDAGDQAGAVTNLPDLDGAVRHGLMLSRFGNRVYSSLALATAMNYLLVDTVEFKTSNHALRGLQIGSTFIPTTPHGQVLIPFWGQAGTLNYFSATDILQNKVPKSELQGAIAIIGSTMILLADLHQSPVAQSFPGVEMVGNIVQAIVNQQLVAPFNWFTINSIFLMLAIGLVFTILFSKLGVSGILSLAAISIVSILTLAIYLFVYKGIYVATGYILTMILLQTISNYAYLFIIEKRQKRKINQLFGQYVPEQYVKELIDSPGQYSMEGQVRNMTVQFTDIRSFTSISEALDASHVKRLLNTFFTPITEIIFSFRGTIDKYVGDMIVAFWGAPIVDADHAYHAILTSLTMIQKLPEINVKMVNLNLPAVNIGIGLASGLMNVGDMGSEFRRAYTVLGDTVNLGSRLQDLTKYYHVNILVSDATRNGQNKFLWRTIDKITVKGRKTGLVIYEPIGLASEASENLISELEMHETALQAYYARQWQTAEELFLQLKSSSPQIYVYEMFLERINEFKQSMPDDSWEGIYIHLHK